MNKGMLLSMVATISLIFLVFSGVWPSAGEKQKSTKRTKLYVLSASSLTDVMKEQEVQFESDHPKIDLVISYAASGKLQKQIEQGAQADIFLSAGIRQINALENKNLIKDRANLLENKIVLINHRDSPKISDVEDLSSPEIESIAIGYPGTVPAGKYAKQALQAMSLWERLKPKFVYANSVQQVLTYVETGNVEAGFVYKTDFAHASKPASLVQQIDPRGHDPITYPIGIIAATENPSASKTLFDWLQTNTATQIFQNYGFQIHNQDGTK